MARIAGVDIPREKHVGVALCYIYGIGPSNAKRLLAQAGVPPETKVKDLTEEEIMHIREAIDRGYRVGGELRREISTNVQRLVEIGSYRGLRHKRSLPVHGQRTRTNARTKRGPRKTIAGRGHKRGVGRK